MSVMTDFSFDTYFNFFKPEHTDSPFDQSEGFPYVYSPFTLDKSLGTKEQLDFPSINPNTKPINSPRFNTVSYPGTSETQGQTSPKTSSPTISSPQTNTTTTQTNNTSQTGTTTNNTNNTLTPTPTTQKKKKKTIFSKKKKKTKGYTNTTPFEQVVTNQDLQTDFTKYLQKKKLNENNLKFFVAITRFEQESGDVHSRAMNICFEYLGIGGGELTVTVETRLVAELSQIIRNKQSSKEMFVGAKNSVVAKLRLNFTTFMGTL